MWRWRRGAADVEAPGARTEAADDLIIIAVCSVALFFVLTMLDVFGYLAAWLHSRQLVDDVVCALLVVSAGIAVFAWRRWKEVEAARRQLRILSGVIRLCVWCRKARNAEGTWIPLEDYVERQSEADVSPDLCPDCSRRIPGAGARRTFF